MDAARRLNIRIAIFATGVIVAAVWLMSSGKQSVILVDFGMAPEELVGAQVVIDDEVVGVLKKMGARAQTGFKVKDGDHVIRVEVPGLGSEPARVTTGFGGNQVMLLVDFQERSGETTVVLGR